ncbi:MAG TPA: ParB/RepB/Spo0J family partition protein [Peptococcaceae bacterium]|nr:ParB/RepB/Spo0J family partition protein [Clostridia bacterium]HOB82034.1 ParB/RepB/Spo0J family partition protein [Peptococcaceae bacterium]HPZ70878.1 ParB/RepB/Spo0J family partition protein [Peptococcaceae bacterium]HQD54224.1 ParB/RepB/Spo0J family partition protein [Peptococcaceae bacterium]
MRKTKTGLGKGLSALIPPVSEEINKEETAAAIKISSIIPNTFQPRREFDEDKLTELAESIKEHGVVQPIVVRKISGGRYELVVGERRLRACQRLKIREIPAIVKEYTDEQMMEIALIENIQRQDLNPLEEAYAYKRLLEEFNLTQEEVAKKISKSRSFVANMVRILNLPQEVLDLLAGGDLTVGHVRPLLALNSAEQQIKAAEEMRKKQMTVREAEEFTKGLLEAPQKQMMKRKKMKLSPELIDLENKLRNVCGTKVAIKNKGEKGKIEIEYYNNDDLNRILAIFFNEELA